MTESLKIIPWTLNKNNIKNPKFSKQRSPEFAVALRGKVNDYFKTNNLSKYGNGSMVVKTIFMLSVYFIPLLLINMGIISAPWLLFTLYIIAGLGMSGIGMGIMHDAIHGSYSKNKTINKYLGLSINLIGANASVWRIQHNVLHHTYTNIDSLDDDINPPFFLRFSPHAKHYWVHQFQHIYIWLFYGLSTLSWVTAKDFIRLPRYKNMGYLQGKNEMRNELLNSIGWKLLHYTITLALPIIMVPLAPWITILAFVSMHFVTGIFISIVFQTAHVMPGNEYPLPDENGLIANNWSVHQLATTCNF
ncbi:MAG: fatty acid desaturase, partial [Cyclobacteriaceae bacterium]|nr:fatty acid desaturase [Cyclobacteriaceae bacterium]